MILQILYISSGFDLDVEAGECRPRSVGWLAGLEWKGDNRASFLPPWKHSVLRPYPRVVAVRRGRSVRFRSSGPPSDGLSHRRPGETVNAPVDQADPETSSPGDPLMNRLERFMDEKDRPGDVVCLVMDDREPFPEQRLQVLERRLTELGGRILSAEDRTVHAEISPDTDLDRLEGLFHWERRTADRDSDG